MLEASLGAKDAIDLFPPDAAAWISDTPMRAEYARLMRGFHRPVPWEETHAPRLDPALRAELARIWGERIPTEYRSITGFSTLSFDFIAAGAPVDLVAVCHRVCIDELRHTEMAVKMVEIYGGHQPPLPREISSMPADESLTAVAQACRSAILLSCLGETFACTELAMLRNRTVDPVVHGVLTVFLADEIVHARVGWAYLAHAFKTADDVTRRSVAAAVPSYIAGIRGEPVPVRRRRSGRGRCRRTTIRASPHTACARCAKSRTSTANSSPRRSSPACAPSACPSTKRPCSRRFRADAQVMSKIDACGNASGRCFVPARTT